MSAINGAIWIRVSDGEKQNAKTQLAELSSWAKRRGVTVRPEHVFVIEDSASNEGLARGKGDEYDRARAELAEGARMGEYRVVLIWALDRLSRRGYKDLAAVLDRLAACDCQLWSKQEEWLQTIGPFGEIVVHMLAWMAEQETRRLSERTRAGMAQAKADGKVIGGRKPGAKDKKPGAKANRSAGVAAAWRGPGGQARRDALAERNRARAAAGA